MMLIDAGLPKRLFVFVADRLTRTALWIKIDSHKNMHCLRALFVSYPFTATALRDFCVAIRVLALVAFMPCDAVTRGRSDSLTGLPQRQPAAPKDPSKQASAARARRCM